MQHKQSFANPPLGTTRTLDSHASRLRHKLTYAGDKFIVNVWGVRRTKS